MITKEQLQAMSDLEINQLLTAYALGNPWIEFGELVNEGKEFHVANAVGEPFYCAVINYCNTPNDIMPLAFEHDVSLIKMLSGWRACTNNGIYVVHYFDDENPLRAIVCCLTLVLQAQK